MLSVGLYRTGTPLCVKNIGPSIKDHVLCQLSDSDRILHPDNLRPEEGFYFRSIEEKEIQIQSKEIHCYEGREGGEGGGES